MLFQSSQRADPMSTRLPRGPLSAVPGGDEPAGAADRHAARHQVSGQPRREEFQARAVERRRDIGPPDASRRRKTKPEQEDREEGPQAPLEKPFRNKRPADEG